MSAADRLDQIEARAQAAIRAKADPEAKPGVWVKATAGSAKDVPALVAAVRAVLDKHQPLDAIHTVTGKPLQVCSGCGRDRDWMPWPCPTVRAVTDALGGEPR